jgi:nitrous oxide reductase accessory protein NosL
MTDHRVQLGSGRWVKDLVLGRRISACSRASQALRFEDRDEAQAVADKFGGRVHTLRSL